MIKVREKIISGIVKNIQKNHWFEPSYTYEFNELTFKNFQVKIDDVIFEQYTTEFKEALSKFQTWEELKKEKEPIRTNDNKLLDSWEPQFILVKSKSNKWKKWSI